MNNFEINRKSNERLTRRAAFGALFGAFVLFDACSCALFDKSKKTTSQEASEEAFQDEEFQTESSKKKGLSSFFARDDDSGKTKTDAGQTFLLSDTSKEIYANTER